MEKIIIITGGNKGIGQGIVTTYLANGYKVFSISRTIATQKDTNLINLQFDLSDDKGLDVLMTQILTQLKPNEIERIVLFNNAGTLGQIGRTESLVAKNVATTIHLNTIAPILLTSAFIKFTESWICEKKVINISSGAAQNAYYGWTLYCASKAALDMMTKTIALEQQAVENGIKIIAIYPGVVDTDMQTEIRKHKKEDFIAIDRFLELKSSGLLLKPIEVGQKIFEIDQRELENGSILRVE